MPNLIDIPAQVREWARRLATPKPMRRGSLSVRSLRCNKPGCACASRTLKKRHYINGQKRLSTFRPRGGARQGSDGASGSLLRCGNLADIIAARRTDARSDNLSRRRMQPRSAARPASSDAARLDHRAARQVQQARLLMR